MHLSVRAVWAVLLTVDLALLGLLGFGLWHGVGFIAHLLKGL